MHHQNELVSYVTCAVISVHYHVLLVIFEGSDYFVSEPTGYMFLYTVGGLRSKKIVSTLHDFFSFAMYARNC